MCSICIRVSPTVLYRSRLPALSSRCSQLRARAFPRLGEDVACSSGAPCGVRRYWEGRFPVTIHEEDRMHCGRIEDGQRCGCRRLWGRMGRRRGFYLASRSGGEFSGRGGCGHGADLVLEEWMLGSVGLRLCAFVGGTATIPRGSTLPTCGLVGDSEGSIVEV